MISLAFKVIQTSPPNLLFTAKVKYYPASGSPLIRVECISLNIRMQRAHTLNNQSVDNLGCSSLVR